MKNCVVINNAPFRSYISEINSTFLDNAEDRDIVRPMYNLLERSQSYSMTWERLWNYYGGEIDNINDNASHDKLFKYKTKIVTNTPAGPENEGDANWPALPTLNFEVTIRLKYLSSNI